MQRMKSIITGVLFLSAVVIGSAYADSGLKSDFNARYGTSSTALNTCSLCHTSAPDFNSYGQDLADNGINFAAIEGFDSDGDGYSNLTEITARTFPGNASSFPATGDTTLPTVNTFTIPATSSSLTVAISALTATDNTGVTGYLVNESSTKPSATAAGWSASAPASYTFATQGAKTLYAWAKDAAGNVSNSRNAAVTVTLPVADTTLPTVNTFTIPATSSSLTVAISALTATDNVGVTGYLVNESSTKPSATAAGWSASAPASYTFATQGAKTLYAWAKDAAGNVSNSRTAAVTVTLPAADTTLPSVNTFTIPSTSSSLTVAISALSATDNVGVTGYLVNESSTKPSAGAAGWSATVPASYTFATQGSKTLYAWAKDSAGNVSNSRSALVTVTITTPPPPGAGGLISPATSGLYWDDTNKRIGIGTESPAARLSITDEVTNANRGILTSQNTSDPASAVQILRKSRGTAAFSTSVLEGDYLGSLSFRGYDGASYLRNAFIGSRVSGPVTNGSVPTDLFFSTSATDDPDPYTNGSIRMVITPSGDIGIGTVDPGQRLEVNGGVKLNPDAIAEPKPVCNVDARGTFWFTQDNAAGDSAEVCARVGGSYAWRRLF